MTATAFPRLRVHHTADPWGRDFRSELRRVESGGGRPRVSLDAWGRPFVEAGAGDASGTGSVPEGSVADLLAYYKLWTPFVAGVAHAMRAQGDAWAAMAAGKTPSAVPNAVAATNDNPATNVSQWTTLAEGCYGQADHLASSWNAHAGSTDWQKMTLAGGFLQDYASVVKLAGQLAAQNRSVWPAGATAAPADPTQSLAAEPGGWPAPPDASVQVDVIARIQALRVVASGVLEALQLGAAGALETTAELTAALAKKTGEVAGAAADGAAAILTMLPWAVGGLLLVLALLVLSKEGRTAVAGAVPQAPRLASGSR